METSEQINELAAALSLAQGEMEAAPKQSTNPHFRSKFADLASCMRTVKPALSKHGLALIQATSRHPSEPGGYELVTRLAHKSGQWIQARWPISTAGGPQKMGSELTYARRYTMALVGLVTDDDDDAEAATGRNPQGHATHIVGMEPGPPNDTSLSNEKRALYLAPVIKCLEAGDKGGFEQLIDELTEGERRGLWFFFSSKQKALARELLQTSVPAGE